jgi:hypothetical protein
MVVRSQASRLRVVGAFHPQREGAMRFPSPETVAAFEWTDETGRWLRTGPRRSSRLA